MNETTQEMCVKRHAKKGCPLCMGRGLMMLVAGKDLAQVGCWCVKNSFARPGTEKALCKLNKIRLAATERCGGCEHLTSRYESETTGKAQEMAESAGEK